MWIKKVFIFTMVYSRAVLHKSHSLMEKTNKVNEEEEDTKKMEKHTKSSNAWHKKYRETLPKATESTKYCLMLNKTKKQKDRSNFTQDKTQLARHINSINYCYFLSAGSCCCFFLFLSLSPPSIICVSMSFHLLSLNKFAHNLSYDSYNIFRSLFSIRWLI